MDEVIRFSHTNWHRAYVYFTLALLVAVCAVLAYAALFAPPRDQWQWIPLIGMLVVFGGYTVLGFRHVGVLKLAYVASPEGITVQRDGRAILDLKWGNVVEVKRSSALTGMGFIRSASPPAKHVFLNVFGEANRLAEFAIQHCVEVHGG